MFIIYFWKKIHTQYLYLWTRKNRKKENSGKHKIRKRSPQKIGLKLRHELETDYGLLKRYLLPALLVKGQSLVFFNLSSPPFFALASTSSAGVSAHACMISWGWRARVVELMRDISTVATNRTTLLVLPMSWRYFTISAFELYILDFISSCFSLFLEVFFFAVLLRHTQKLKVEAEAKWQAQLLLFFSFWKVSCCDVPCSLLGRRRLFFSFLSSSYSFVWLP